MSVQESTLATIKSRIRIADIVGEQVRLQRKGHSEQLWGRCPFHEEKTPSFTVQAAKGFYKCFGCGKGGDAIHFLQESKSMSYLEAMRYLADKYGVAWEETNSYQSKGGVQEEKGHGLYETMAMAQQYYTAQLSEAVVAQDYLATRGITPELIVQFGLGYSPNAWQGLYTYAQKRGYETSILIEVGLVIAQENKKYDRFRGRCLFPIYDTVGRVVGFGGRSMQSQSGAKYINTPQTPIYKKSSLLYGLYQARQVIRKVNQAYLVEGYTDVLGLWSCGIQNVVASAGTALTEEQVALLKRYTSQVTLLFDGDTAGKKAILRGVDLLLAQGLEVKVVALPVGEDPASYAQKLGKGAFSTFLKGRAEDFVTYKMATLMAQVEDADGRARVVREVVRSIAKIQDPIKQGVYVQVCSQLTDLEERTIRRGIAQVLWEGEPSRVLKGAQASIQKERRYPIERVILYMLLHNATTVLGDNRLLGDYILEELTDITFLYKPYHRLYQHFVQHWQTDKELSPSHWLQSLPADLQAVAVEVMANRHEISEAWEIRYHIASPKGVQNIAKLAYQNILRLKLRAIHELLATAHKKFIIDMGPAEEDRSMATYMAIKKVQIEIATELGIDVFPPRGLS